MPDKEATMIDMEVEARVGVDITPLLKHHAKENPNVISVDSFIAAVHKNMMDFIKENYGEVRKNGGVS